MNFLLCLNWEKPENKKRSGKANQPQAEGAVRRSQLSHRRINSFCPRLPRPSYSPLVLPSTKGTNFTRLPASASPLFSTALLTFVKHTSESVTPQLINLQ